MGSTSGLDSVQTMQALGETGMQWIRRVPETSMVAKEAIDLDADDGQEDP